MTQDEKLKQLKKMLTQVSPKGNIESVATPEAPRMGALESLGPGPDAEAAAAAANAQSGLQKLKEGRDADVTPQEMRSLEAIVLPDNRPVTFVRNGSYDDLSGEWTSLNEAAVRTRLGQVLPSIGRVELPKHPAVPFGGTAFVVGPNLLMTNRHVAELFAQGLGMRRLVYRSGSAAVDFRRQFDTAADDRTGYFVVEGVEMIHPFWDMALLRVPGLGDHYKPLSLSVVPPDELIDHNVVVVGYPARDSRNDLALQDRVFGGVFNVKRLQPGKLRQRAQINSFESRVNSVTHDCSTLGGNSGSAVVDVATGEVVGLHFAGVYLQANYAVPTYELARDRRVQGLRLNFVGTPAPTNDWEPAWTQADAGEAAAPAAAPQAQAPIAPAGQAVAALQAPAQSAGGTVTVTIPLHITVTLGQPLAPSVITSAAATASAISAPTEAPHMQVPIIYGGLENRLGYNPGYLNLPGNDRVPLPAITAAGQNVTAKLEDGSSELKYHKFSVVMHRGRRLALFTAANVDWRQSSRLVDGRKPTRHQLTGLQPGQLEKWVTDWRIDESHQLPDVFFTKDGGAFDKGHLTRRDDVCWGSSFKDIQKGNGDTYHTTNCSPQTGAFNQASKGEDNWGDLEGLVQSQTKAETAVVFSGPVLAEDDPLFEGRDDDGAILLRIPRKYWKIIVVGTAAGAQAFAFVLEQDLTGVPRVEEFAVPAKWRPYMRSIADVEDLLGGLVSMSWLKGHDQFESDEGVRIAELVQG